MKLSDTAATLEESRLAFNVMLFEDDEGPRWKFGYDNHRVDPNPDILLLGAYRHPKTGNNLIGGINLHYLNKKERDELARNLPNIMGGGNLYERYWIGRRVAPRIFNQYYRTYNARYVRGVTTDVLYPKYGMMKTTKNWLKKKLGGIFKSKAQRQKDAEPKYPQDLDNMQDRLDQVVQQLQQQQEERPDTQPDTPEMRAARDAFLQYQRERTMQDIERRENVPMRQAQHDASEQDDAEQQAQLDPERNRNALERHRQENQQELLRPENDLDLDDDEDVVDRLEEAIAYYSPVAGHVVFERFSNIVHENKPIFSEGWGDQQTLSGEYWLDDGDAAYAENDYDHTMLVMAAARAHIDDELELALDNDEIIDWDELRVALCDQQPQLAEEIMMSWAGPRPNLEAFLAQYGITMELWDVAGWMGETEPRVYAAREWGWVRNEGNSLETFALSRSKLREIARGLENAYGDEHQLEKESFDIYVYSTKRFYNNVPFDVIEAGDMVGLRDHDRLQRGVA
jgi:hypothetical protein